MVVPLLARRFLSLRASVGLAALLLGVSAARAQLYVSDYNAGTISSYTTGGATIQSPLVSSLTANAGMAVNPGTGDIFVTSQQGGGAGYVGSYTSSGATINAGLITGLSGPVALAFGPANTLFVASFDSGTVGQYTAGGAVVNASFITGLSGPSGLAFDSSGNLYVTNYSNGTIGKYNGATGAAINTSLVTGLSNPFGVAVSSAGNVYVANSTNDTIGQYDATTGATLNASLISTPSRPTAMVISSNTLFVVNQNADSVSAYTLAGGTVNASLITGLNNSFGIAAIPEPGTWAAFAGLVALGAALFRRRQSVSR